MTQIPSRLHIHIGETSVDSYVKINGSEPKVRQVDISLVAGERTRIHMEMFPDREQVIQADDIEGYLISEKEFAEFIALKKNQTFDEIATECPESIILPYNLGEKSKTLVHRYKNHRMLDDGCVAPLLIDYVTCPNCCETIVLNSEVMATDNPGDE